MDRLRYRKRVVAHGAALQQHDWRVARLESGMDGCMWLGGWKYEVQGALGKYSVGDLLPW